MRNNSATNAQQRELYFCATAEAQARKAGRELPPCKNKARSVARISDLIMEPGFDAADPSRTIEVGKQKE